MKYFSLLALLASNIFCYGSSKIPAYFKYFFTVIEDGKKRVIETSLIKAENKDFSRESLMKFGKNLPLTVSKVGVVIYEHNKTTPTQRDRMGNKIEGDRNWHLWYKAKGDFENEQSRLSKYKSELEKSKQNIFKPKPSEFESSNDRLSAPLLEYLQVPISENQSYKETLKINPWSKYPLLYIDQQTKSPQPTTCELQYLVIDLEDPEKNIIETIEQNDSVIIYIDQTERVN